MKGHVAPEVKNRRSETLHRVGEKVSEELLKKISEGQRVSLLRKRIRRAI